MKYIIVILIIIMNLAILSAEEYRIVDSRTGKTLSLQQMANELKKYDLIFFGEDHDNATLHKLERELVPLLDTKRELILSLEMFERDVQSDLDAYIEGWLTEDEFLAKSRPWSNYKDDYRPLIEYAKQKKLTVIAANIPRSIAGKMARTGPDFTDTLPEEDKKWLPNKISYPDDSYKKAFLETLENMHSPMMNNNPDWLYQAQCLKDETMAESIVNALKMKPKARVLHFNGDFHSRYFSGTVSRVQEILPKKKIAVISPSYSENWQTANLTAEEKNAGTYIIFLPIQGGEQ
ncbi:MAG: ChaN family lipoprotein [Candidatus Cloacimonas sp.]|nr:ChaN family lipoprotein [Candidatus Cloacimonas sp.]